MLVPVSVPSFDWSGDTHVLKVGDAAEWQLAVAETRVPFLPTGFVFDLDAETRQATEPAPSADYYPTLLVQGGLTAWWDPGKPPPSRVQMKCWFVMDSTQLDPDDMPTTTGVIHSLHAHFWAYAGRTSEHLLSGTPRPEFVGLRPVDSTTDEDLSGMTAHAVRPGLDWPDPAEWWLMGWIAMLEVAD